MVKYYVLCKINNKKKIIPIFATSRKKAKILAKKQGYKILKIYNEKQLSKLSYIQARKKFPFLKPNGNIDKDSKNNSKDCKPFNNKKQDLDDIEPIALFNGAKREFVSPFSGKRFTNYIIAKEFIKNESLEEQSSY